MKRMITLLLAMLMLAGLAACGSTTTPPADTNPPAADSQQPADDTMNQPATMPEEPETPDEDTTTNQPAVEDKELEQLLNTLIEGVSDEIAVETFAVDPDRYSWYFGVDYQDGYEAYASEAMISAVAHSVALLKVPEETDAAALAQTIEENLDPRKWICVEAEANIVKQSGQYILVVQSFQEDAQTVVDNFDAYFAS